MVVLPVVLGQQVAAEVAGVVAPHAVHVVGVALRVVVLDEERRPLDAVVVRLALGLAAHPDEADAVESGVAHLGQPLVGDGAGLGGGVLLDDRPQGRLLVGVEVLVRHPEVFEQGDPPLGAGQDVAGRLVREQRRRALLVVQRSEQRPRLVFLAAEDPQALPRPAAHLGRVRAEELGGGGDGAVDDGPVLRDVVPLVAPTPRGAVARLAEDHEEVEVRVADVAALLLVEDLFELADDLGLGESLLAQARPHEVEGRGPLRAGHHLQRDALAFARDEVPVEAVFAVEREPHGRLLLVVQAVEEPQRGRRHGRRGVGGLLRERDRAQQDDQAGDVEDGTSHDLAYPLAPPLRGVRAPRRRRARPDSEARAGAYLPGAGESRRAGICYTRRCARFGCAPVAQLDRASAF